MFENADTDDLQNFVQRFLGFQSLLCDRHHQVSADRRPDLAAHSVVTAAVETANSQMLFNPFEEQFDLPSIAIKVGDDGCWQIKLVGEQNQRDLFFRIVKTNSS